jgi:hypothetical protein
MITVAECYHVVSISIGRSVGHRDKRQLAWRHQREAFGLPVIMQTHALNLSTCSNTITSLTHSLPFSIQKSAKGRVVLQKRCWAVLSSGAAATGRLGRYLYSTFEERAMDCRKYTTMIRLVLAKLFQQNSERATLRTFFSCVGAILFSMLAHVE